MQPRHLKNEAKDLWHIDFDKKQAKKKEFCSIACICHKKVVLLRRKTQNNTIMAQETLNGLLQYVLLTLPLEDKVWFKQQMEQDIRRLQAEQDEIDMIDQAVEMSLEDVAAGRVYTQEQAHQMMDDFVKSKIQFAAWKSFGQIKRHSRGKR